MSETFKEYNQKYCNGELYHDDLNHNRIWNHQQKKIDELEKINRQDIVLNSGLANKLNKATEMLTNISYSLPMDLYKPVKELLKEIKDEGTV